MSREKPKRDKGREAGTGVSSLGRGQARRLRRSNREAVLAGVCSGVAEFTELPVWLWRWIFLLAILFFGLGAVAYLGLWVFLPGDPVPRPKPPPLFRRIDWWTFGVTTLLVLIGYVYTLAPDLTLEDSGELAVGSFYAGVPHPPGYPVWTLYTWLFTVLVPISNIAWRVALSSAVAGAFACGLIALMASRGTSMILESIEQFKEIDRRLESALCMAAGYVAGMLIGFNGFMWSQAVIVEVYTLSALSLTAVMVCLLRWMYAPEERKYLYWAWFLFGICFTNHQTLIVAAMGIEIAIAVAQPRLGRDLFFWNSVFFLLGLVAKASGMLTTFDANPMLFRIYLLIGLSSILACVWLVIRTQELGSEMSAAFLTFPFWGLGAAFYLYMPVASMTNPPMNWGYPRTWEGFVHALTRGQYERTNPTSDLGRFLDQMDMLLSGAVDEFNLVYLLIGLIPFLFLFRMQRRERAWLIGLVAMYFFLSVLLIVLLNPSADRQSRELNRVFFTASHLMIALCVGYGLALFGALMAMQYRRYRVVVLYGTAISAAIALYAVSVVYQGGEASLLSRSGLFGLEPSHDLLIRFTALFSVFLALFTVGIFAVAREQAPLKALMLVFLLMPAKSILSNWAGNEQRGHLFGYWFGHDMFSPPFGVYPEMARDAILFGGTDPGRFCPTYMIFCEGFIPPRCKPKDPEFDRRDVYIITQNALADATYLNYIRAHYFRSAQLDPPFFQDLVRTRKQIASSQSTFLSRLVSPLDRLFMGLGKRVEDRRRAQGVYPPDEIYTPLPQDHARCMQEYYADAHQRLQQGQLRPGENVSQGADGLLQVSGQVAVMAINALLTKVIFENNPTNEFYVEESFPLDWMFPYLEPFGIIMKINRNPLPEITDEMIQKDHAFWSQYSERLIGNWITYDTPVSEICDFAIRVHERRNYDGFIGDRKFIRDDQAQKAFSKLRSSIGGIYNWRIATAKTAEERQRMVQEADFAFRQALAFCPYSPEAVYRYTTLLATRGRLDDALRVTETALRFDTSNETLQSWVNQLKQAREQPLAPAQPQPGLLELEQRYRSTPEDARAAVELALAYVQLQQTGAALPLLDQALSRSNVDQGTVLLIADTYAKLQQAERLEVALERLTELAPQSPEPWYDLASTRAILGKNAEALAALGRCLELNADRLARDPGAPDLRQNCRANPAFEGLRALPEFQQMIGTAKSP